ncbi:MAG: class I SAM-dependent methyltransferase [Pyrinomonadaceae bacterium]
MKNSATIETGEAGGGAGSFYDSIAHLYDLTFRFNQYGRSLEKYLRANLMPLHGGARILDAGCGTGLLTLALMKVLEHPASINAIDLSASSLVKARRAVRDKLRHTPHHVNFAQANVLALPFANASFELIVTSGALEYVPISEGMTELARVLAPGGYLLHLPVRPSPASKLLEIMFRFKTHPPRAVAEHTERHFRIVRQHHFLPFEPIGWTKTAVLAQKI